MEQPIYITGAGIISAIGVGKNEVLDSLLKGQSGIAPPCHLKTIHKHLPAGEVKWSDAEMRKQLGLDPSFQANRTSLMGSIALLEALNDAGLKTSDCRDAYLISGTTVGGMDYTERHYLDMVEHDEHLSLLRTHECGATSHAIAESIGLKEVHIMTPSTACSSAANAIIVGANLIKTGRADIVIAGGSEALSKFHYNGFNTLMILDSQQCRPFDETRAGLNLGEGAAYLVLESEKSIRARGAQPLFQLDGYGNTCDAYHQTASSNNGEGAYLAMRAALEMAGLHPADISYVNAHGTGTPNNDISESRALQRVFADNMPAVSSTKSFTGHTTSASGSLEAVICLLALQHSFHPANLGWQHPMPDGIIPTLGATGECMQHVMCNSFGFGGNDSSLILSKVDTRHHAGITTPLPTIYVKAISVHRPADGPVDIMQFVPKMEARRMCKLLKSAIFTSLTALKQAGIDSPDGIVTATEYGMLENSEKFLTQMCSEGEDCLKPTLFMQSTHNTISGALGILLKCHGYNITFSDGPDSLRSAILDARLQLELGRARHMLVGYHNELTTCFADMERRLYGHETTPGETCIVLVLSTESENAQCTLDDLNLETLIHT